MADGQATAVRQHLAGNVAGTIVAAGAGVTSSSANTEKLVTHGAVDHHGNAYPAASLLVIAMALDAGTNPLYEGTAISATQFDIRSAGTSINYNYIVVLKN